MVVGQSRRSSLTSRIHAELRTGESGLGKTTLINTLFSTELSAPKNYNRRHLKQLDKLTEVEIIKAELEEKQFKAKLSVIDTPGFGDYVNNRDSWSPIVDFIDDQHEAYMRQEQQPLRTDKTDLRVHACLYFIRPTGHTSVTPPYFHLSQYSLSFFPQAQALGHRNHEASWDAREPHSCDCESGYGHPERPLRVQTTSKGHPSPPPFQSLTRSLQIREVIAAQGIRIYQPPIDTDDEAAAENARVLLDAMPFSIIGSTEDVTTHDGRVVKGREYLWGVAEGMLSASLLAGMRLKFTHLYS